MVHYHKQDWSKNQNVRISEKFIKLYRAIMFLVLTILTLSINEQNIHLKLMLI